MIPPRALILSGALATALGNTACIKKMLVNGQIEGTRQGSVAFDEVGDWDLGYRAASASIVQFEGMHVLAPDNEDALFLLAKGYTGYAYGFVEDEMERAQDDGDRTGAEYHLRRASNAYTRGIAYGLEAMSHKDKGFEAVKAKDPELRAWLKKNFTSPDDAPILFWTGYAWLAKVNLSKEDAEAVATLYQGLAILERSVELDPAFNHYAGTVALAGYHARSATAELDDAKALFEKAIAGTKRGYLLAQFNYASKWACSKADVASYEKFLGEVLSTEDSGLGVRLSNIIARRRAQRWQAEKRMFDMCGIEKAPAAPAAASRN